MEFLLPSRQTNEGNTALIRMSSFPATDLVYLVQFPFPELYRRLVLLSRHLRFEDKDSVLSEMSEFEQKAACRDASKWKTLLFFFSFFLSWVSCDVTGREIRLRGHYQFLFESFSINMLTHTRTILAGRSDYIVR